MSLAFEAMNKTKDDYELRIEQLEAEIERLNKVIDDLIQAEFDFPEDVL
jgi:prefoldin subunit 5